jgi:hypothetical protein
MTAHSQKDVGRGELTCGVVTARSLSAALDQDTPRADPVREWVATLCLPITRLEVVVVVVQTVEHAL